MSANANLFHLFDAELRFQEGMAPVVSSEHRDGELIGSGDGAVSGPKLQGKVLWSYFAADCAYKLVKAGIEPGPGLHLCRNNPGGTIRTQDGAEIRFDARGYGLRGADPASPHKWRLSAALQFATEDSRYKWLNTTLAIWEGEFDEKLRRALYRAYAPRPFQPTIEQRKEPHVEVACCSE
jgi:hypothetical protein